MWIFEFEKMLELNFSALSGLGCIGVSKFTKSDENVCRIYKTYAELQKRVG